MVVLKNAGRKSFPTKQKNSGKLGHCDLQKLMALLFLFSSFKSIAQTNNDEDWRLGFMAGTTLYYSNMPLGIHAAGALNVIKPHILHNNNLTFRAQLSYGNLSASYYSPLGQALQKFNAQALELALLTEYDILSLERMGFTPYLVAGVGLANYSSNSGYNINNKGTPQKSTINLPIGIGFKIRLTDELFVQMEYLHRLSYPEPINGLQKDAWGQAMIGLNFPFPRQQKEILKCWKG
ncbi:MAG: hypothetical protein JST58_19480 [Bacteroidetes bacterium]|nr:hypothetical protein [Bacteroidota bacterium]